MDQGREQQSPGAIVEAVESCVAYATASGERPFQHVAEFLGALQQSGWTARDLDRVRSLALAELVKLREDRQGGLPHSDSS
jgi:hypothetical protein